MSPLDQFAQDPRWVAWRNEQRGEKLTKVPYCRFDRKAKADDPGTWVVRAAAEQAAKKLVNGKGGGIGIELGDLGGDLFMCGIDLDTCIDGGKFEPWADEVFSAT